MPNLEDFSHGLPNPESIDQPFPCTINLVIVDDHTLFREATITALQSDPQIRILGEGSSATDALTLAEQLRPDLILLDVAMPGGGLNAARAIASANPKIKIMMLTFSEEEDDVRKAIAAGVQGYVLKGVSGTGLRMVVRAVFSGEHFISVDVSRAAIASRQARTNEP
jgi:two-component system, NarL family, nitrate/nitrite response regulator NarL